MSLLKRKSLRFKLLIDLTKSNVLFFLLTKFSLHFCFSFIQFLLSHFLCSDGQFSLPLKDFMEIVFVLLTIAQRFDLDPSSF